MRSELAPSSSTMRRRREAEHLVAAAVGQDRPRPADEAVQAAGARDEIVARPQVQVIGVAEDDLGAERRSRSRCVTPLTAPCVPTGMNAGVCTTPCGVRQLAAARARRRIERRETETSDTLRIRIDSPAPAYARACCLVSCYPDPRETTSRRRALRRPIGRARSVARVGGGRLRATSIAHRYEPVADPDREGRPLGARGPAADGDRRRPRSSSRRGSRRRGRSAAAARCTSSRSPSEETILSIDRAPRRRRPSRLRLVTGLAPRRDLPGAARSVRRGRHDSGPARARERALRRRRRAGLGGRHGQGA